MYPDRRSHTGLLELKNVLRPVRVTGYDRRTGALELRNMLDFTDAEDALEIHYLWKQEENVLEEGMISEFHLPPHRTMRVMIPPLQTVTGADETVLTIELIQKKDAPLTKAGHLLGFDQIVLAANADAVTQELSLAKSVALSLISCTETETEYCFAAEHFTCRVSKRTGTVVSFIKDRDRVFKTADGV